ncbi:Protein-cysteine N-palmitoyltransferase HHAT [Aphelenchoides besseyi]|nr:Protein-cysteine N-palmitoyltransferase HHAT [Aphelenchoides besseyi]KAI6200725.1 Protein-cysteine N-palmitoyltransferase HHAT [Aphelenchoides besseyi]
MSTNVYPIGHLELGVYFVVSIIHCALGCALAVRASFSNQPWLKFALKQSDYVSKYDIDDSDVEWMLFRGAVAKLLVGMTIHSVIYRMIREIRNERLRSLMLIIFWLGLNTWLTSSICIINCLLLCIVVTALTRLLKTELVAWILCVVFVCSCSSSWIKYDQSDEQTYYREYQLYIYLSVLNFNIHLRRNPNVQLNFDLLCSFLEYAFYPPYTSLLIVLFEDYCQQKKNIKSTNIKHVLFYAFRLIFWFYLIELALHFTRVNVFFSAPYTLVNNFHNYELFSIAYVRGQFFHTKYVVIFGIPRLFAHIDGMQPPGPAICISRISKYSKMWRYFDRGLYDFLKTQLYIPLIQITPYPQVGRFLAMLVVFGFVLLWHGVNFNFFAWVALSALELIIERLGYMFYTSALGTKVRIKIGDANFVRLTAVALLTNVIPGIFGAFFFLDRRDLALKIFNKVLVQGIVDVLTMNIHYANSGFVLLHLLLLGYCFGHVCSYLHVKLDTREKTKTN